MILSLGLMAGDGFITKFSFSKAIYHIRTFFTRTSFLVISYQEMENQEIREENRRMRFLRFLVDLCIQSIQLNDLSLEEALRLVEEVKRAALNLFPGKEAAFELIYRPRFQRAIEARFGVISCVGLSS